MNNQNNIKAEMSEYLMEPTLSPLLCEIGKTYFSQRPAIWSITAAIALLTYMLSQVAASREKLELKEILISMIRQS